MLFRSFRELVKENKWTNLVKIEKRYGRDYPYTFHAAQTVGFVGLDNNGLEGLEYNLNTILYPGPSLNETLTYGEDGYLTILCIFCQ